MKADFGVFYASFCLKTPEHITSPDVDEQTMSHILDDPMKEI